jgi:hypothetical protein
MSQRHHQQWQQDVDARQRNIIFPDTAANEARFWRNLIARKGRLTVVQWIGLGLMGFTLALVALLPVIWSHKIYGSWVRGVESAVTNWLLGAAFLAVFLIVLTWATRRKQRR